MKEDPLIPVNALNQLLNQFSGKPITTTVPSSNASATCRPSPDTLTDQTVMPNSSVNRLAPPSTSQMAKRPSPPQVNSTSLALPKSMSNVPPCSMACAVKEFTRVQFSVSNRITLASNTTASHWLSGENSMSAITVLV